MRYVLGLMTFALLAPVSLAQSRGALPPGDVWPRTKAESDAKMAAEPWRQTPLSENPETAGLFQLARSRMQAITDEYCGASVVFDAALADRLIDELYVDNGHPTLNSSVQDYILTQMDVVARWPEERLPDAARQRLVAGLLEYVHAGGGSENSPGMQARVAAALDHAGFDDPEAQAEAEALLIDAFNWAEAVDSDIHRAAVSRICEQRWGVEFALMAEEARSRDSVPTEYRNARYERAVAALTALLKDPPRDRALFARAVREATQTALGEFGHPAVCADLTTRLLIVYRCLLARYPPVAERVSDYMQEQLLRLAAKEGGLMTARHWSLWADATAMLGRNRFSDRLKRWVQEAVGKKEFAAGQRDALIRLSTIFTAVMNQPPTSAPASRPASGGK
jgi:hypothetical protein